jgi:hypothetical protein
MEKPIIFSTPMVQAILEGRKTQTRRVCLLQNWSYSELHDLNKNKIFRKIDGNVTCPYNNIGDFLWVRETYSPKPVLYHMRYKASMTELGLHEFKSVYGDWKPAFFMPKDAARIWLQITNVKVERVQDISDSDAKQEGIETFSDGPYNAISYADYLNPNKLLELPKDSYKSLWVKINGLDNWNQNPWVWVIEFKVLSTHGKDAINATSLNVASVPSVPKKTNAQ